MVQLAEMAYASSAKVIKKAFAETNVVGELSVEMTTRYERLQGVCW